MAWARTTTAEQTAVIMKMATAVFLLGMPRAFS
jgi:hypothetical protein